MILVAGFTGLALVAGVGMLVLINSFQPAGPSNADLVDVRLDSYEGVQTMEEMELRRPLSERVFLPVLRAISMILLNSTPQKQLQATQGKLNFVGRSKGMSALDFLALRYVMTAIFALGGLGLGLMTRNGIVTALLLCGGAIGGVIGPGLWLDRKVKSRREEIQLALPDALDLLIVSVEAGLTFEAALARVAEKFHNALAEEFARVLQETRLGRGYLEALEDLASRCEVADVQGFVQAVIQSQQLGGGIAKILRLQSDEIRRRRMQRAEELGAQASIKMLLPMIGCIFPTIWIVLLGPAILIVIHVFGTGR